MSVLGTPVGPPGERSVRAASERSRASGNPGPRAPAVDLLRRPQVDQLGRPRPAHSPRGVDRIARPLTRPGTLAQSTGRSAADRPAPPRFGHPRRTPRGRVPRRTPTPPGLGGRRGSGCPRQPDAIRVGAAPDAKSVAARRGVIGGRRRRIRADKQRSGNAGILLARCSRARRDPSMSFTGLQGGRRADHNSARRTTPAAQNPRVRLRIVAPRIQAAAPD